MVGGKVNRRIVHITGTIKKHQRSFIEIEYTYQTEIKCQGIAQNIERARFLARKEKDERSYPCINHCADRNQWEIQRKALFWLNDRNRVVFHHEK